MTQGQYGGMNPYGSMNPPTSFEYQEEPPATTWPTVLGVIGIILSVLGLLGGCVTLFMPLFMPQFLQMLRDGGNMPEEDINDIANNMPPDWVMYVGGAVGLLLSIWLLVSCIRLMKRRQAGARSLFAWAVVNMVWMLINLVGTILLTPAVTPPANAPAGAQAASDVMQIASTMCGFLIGAAYPIFVIFWMLRSRIKQEVAMWP